MWRCLVQRNQHLIAGRQGALQLQADGCELMLSHPACSPCRRLQEVRVHADGATHLVYVLVE